MLRNQAINTSISNEKLNKISDPAVGLEIVSIFDHVTTTNYNLIIQI